MLVYCTVYDICVGGGPHQFFQGAPNPSHTHTHTHTISHHPLPTAVHNDHACTCFPSHITITNTHTHYLSSGLSPTHRRVLFSLATIKAFPSLPSFSRV